MLQIVLTYVKLLILLSKHFFEFANFELINDLHHLNVGSQSPIHCLKLKFLLSNEFQGSRVRRGFVAIDGRGPDLVGEGLGG